MLNVVALVGRLTSDPELRHTPNSIPVTSFNIAVGRSFVRSGEERQTDFIDVVAWRSTAEFVCKYFKKGQLIAVEGSIQTRTYQDRDGNKRKAFEVVANNVHFTESKKEAADSVGQIEDSKTESQTVAYTSGSDSDFQEIQSDEDLPF